MLLLLMPLFGLLMLGLLLLLLLMPLFGLFVLMLGLLLLLLLMPLFGLLGLMLGLMLGLLLLLLLMPLFGLLGLMLGLMLGLLMLMPLFGLLMLLGKRSMLRCVTTSERWLVEMKAGEAREKANEYIDREMQRSLSHVFRAIKDEARYGRLQTTIEPSYHVFNSAELKYLRDLGYAIKEKEDRTIISWGGGE